MKRIFISLLLIIFFPSLLFSAEDDPVDPHESLCRELLISHLRGNFDDIHDVSMRFHHLDSSLNGLISFDLSWKEGRMSSFSIIDNETGNSDFASELGSAMERWHIPGMPDKCRFNFSLMIKIVGSDDPSFMEKAIFTGEVVDAWSRPVRDARISLLSEGFGNDSVPDGRTNREGIFVRTLIPPGSWNVTITCPGFDDLRFDDLVFSAGEHRREKIVLGKTP